MTWKSTLTVEPEYAHQALTEVVARLLAEPRPETNTPAQPEMPESSSAGKSLS